MIRELLLFFSLSSLRIMTTYGSKSVYDTFLHPQHQTSHQPLEHLGKVISACKQPFAELRPACIEICNILVFSSLLVIIYDD